MTVRLNKILIIMFGISLVFSSNLPIYLDASSPSIETQSNQSKSILIGEVVHDLGIAMWSGYTIIYINFTLVIDNVEILIRVNTENGLEYSKFRYSGLNGSNFDTSVIILNNSINNDIISKLDEEDQGQRSFTTNESAIFFDPQFIEKSWFFDYFELDLTYMYLSSNSLLGGSVMWKIYGYENILDPEPVTETVTETVTSNTTTTEVYDIGTTIQENYTVTEQNNFTTTFTPSQIDSAPFPFFPLLTILSLIVIIIRKSNNR